MRNEIAAGLISGAVVLAGVGAAAANPWVPPAGEGSVKAMVRLTDGNTAYGANGFGTGTVAASKQSQTQWRLTGVQGIGYGFSVEYDLRAASLRDEKTKRGLPVIAKASGLEDEEVGLNYGLTQSKWFADSVELNIVAPVGNARSNPTLGAGHLAVEPDFQAGLARGPVVLTMQAGPRVFVDSGVTQLRGTLYAGWHVLPRLTLFGGGFMSRTLQSPRRVALTDKGEIYSVARLGAGLQWRVNGWLRPYFLYEHTIAGQSEHAGERFTVGFEVRY